MLNFLLVFIGGGLGSVIRFAIGLSLSQSKLNLPLATLLANLLACVIFAGVLFFSQSKLAVSENIKYLLLAGFCGGLSTFSAFSNETFILLKQGLHVMAIGNIVLNLCLCLFVFYWFTK